MIDRSDPERRMSNDEKIMTATSQFVRGAMTEPVYRASLFACGLRGRHIDDLVAVNGIGRPLSEIPLPEGIARGGIR